MGRIPLFINTNCVLPFENQIPWNEICLWIEENEIDSMNEKILDFYQSMSEKEFKDKQIQCRQIWENYFTKNGFITHFYKSLIKSNYMKNVRVSF